MGVGGEVMMSCLSGLVWLFQAVGAFWDLGLLLFFWVAYEMEMFLSYPFVCGASSGGPAAVLGVASLHAWDLGPF